MNESTVSLICSKFEPLSIDEVKTLMLGHEARLDKFYKKNSSVTVNLTQGASSSDSSVQPIQAVQVPKSVVPAPTTTTTTTPYPTRWGRLHGSTSAIMFYQVPYFYPNHEVRDLF